MFAVETVETGVGAVNPAGSLVPVTTTSSTLVSSWAKAAPAAPIAKIDVVNNNRFVRDDGI